MTRASLRSVVLVQGLLLFGLSPAFAKVEFRKRELFTIPFGTDRLALGAKVEGGNLLIPREFSMDGLGRFYINDSQKHRIARYSPVGAYEMGIQYPPTALQVFAQPDAQNNLWLLISDPTRGFYYGIYDPQGKRLREGVFAQFNQFRLHVGDDRGLRVILSSSKNKNPPQIFLLDPESFLMKKQTIALPLEGHHEVRRKERSYYVHPIPGASGSQAEPVMQITDDSKKEIGQIKGHVIYITDAGEIYTRVGDCRVNVYGVSGDLEGTLAMDSLPAICTALRFDGQGHIYLLEGIANDRGQYTADMPGMHVILWERR